MNNELSKTIWKEGSFICPQHFQKQEEYFENLIKINAMLGPYPRYGLIDLEIDSNLLKANQVMIKKISGIMADGTYFNAPEYHNLPPIILIQEEQKEQMLYIGIAKAGALYKSSNEKECRYNISNVQCFDLTQPHSDKKELEVASLNLQILQSNEINDYIILNIAKITNSIGGIILDKQHVPTILYAHSSQILKDIIKYINAFLLQCGNTNEFGFINSSGYTILELMFSQIIGRYKVIFSMMEHNKYLLPYELFNKLNEYYAELSLLYQQNSKLEEVIRYNHNNLSMTFGIILQAIKELNELVKEQLQNSLMLEYDQSKSIFKSKLPAKFLESKRSLFLIIIGNNINNIDELFRQTKIGSDSTIDKIMRLQIKGVKFSVNSQQTIDYVQNIKQITIEINSNGEFYEDMKDDKSICVDVGNFKNQNLRLRLLSIL